MRVIVGITIIFMGIALLVGGLFFWFKLTYPTYIYRFLMTVEVEADGQTHVGSSVIQGRATKNPKIFPEVIPIVTRVEGEAVAVDLPNGKTLFAALAIGPDANQDRFNVLVPFAFGLKLEDADIKRLPSLRGRRELTPAQWPTLITFTDPADKKTVRIVAPDQLEQVFGPGVRLKRVTIEMTTDPVTRRLGARLPWLSEGDYLKAKLCAPEDQPCLHRGHLSW